MKFSVTQRLGSKYMNMLLKFKTKFTYVLNNDFSSEIMEGIKFAYANG